MNNNSSSNIIMVVEEETIHRLSHRIIEAAVKTRKIHN
jgi:hypothetical protein